MREKIAKQLILSSSNIPRVHIHMADIMHEQAKVQQGLISLQRNVEQLRLAGTDRVWENRSEVTDFHSNVQNVQTASDIVSNLRQAPTKSSTIRIGATVLKQQVCRKFCMCCCHKKTNLTSPTWLQDVFGTLFRGYTAKATANFPCSQKMCKWQ